MSSYSKVNKASKSNSSSNSSQSNKPFCKVCYDAGKPAREYTSHYVKSKPGDEGKVICPYLLSLVCTYCKKQKGHTARHCPVLLQKSKLVVKRAVSEGVDQCNDGWKVVSNKQTLPASPASSAPKPLNITCSRLADTPPPREIMQTKNTWAKITAAKPVALVAKPMFPTVPVEPTPSPTPDALFKLNNAEQRDLSDYTEEETEEETEDGDEGDIQREDSIPAPYRYVYGEIRCWADEE